MEIGIGWTVFWVAMAIIAAIGAYLILGRHNGHDG